MKPYTIRLDRPVILITESTNQAESVNQGQAETITTITSPHLIFWMQIQRLAERVCEGMLIVQRSGVRRSGVRSGVMLDNWVLSDQASNSVYLCQYMFVVLHPLFKAVGSLTQF